MVFVEWDRLAGLQSLSEDEEILRVPKLAIYFDGEWHSLQWSRSMHEVIAVVLLQNHWFGGSACVLALGSAGVIMTRLCIDARHDCSGTHPHNEEAYQGRLAHVSLRSC